MNKEERLSWADRQASPVAVVDWKESAKDVIRAVNHQLRYSEQNSDLRIRLRETLNGFTLSLRCLTNWYGGMVIDKAYGEYQYAEEVLHVVDELLRRAAGLKVVFDPTNNSDSVVWVLRRDRRLRGSL